MQSQLANLVHPVVSYGLDLQARLKAGARPNLDNEQTILKDLLLSEFEARRWTDYGGDLGRGNDASTTHRGSVPRIGSHFLGVRYALVCWLDELFTCDSPWSPLWNEQKLEVELYGSNDRAWKFWEQARLAQARPGSDALEVFFLCVMLGFRGELRDRGEELKSWIATAKLRLGNVHEIDWPFATELDPPTLVPPLRGRDRLRRMVLTSWFCTLLLIPIAAFVFVHKLSQ